VDGLKAVSKPLKILIIKASSRGDILQLLSILPHIEVLAPKAKIDWVIEKPFCELVEHHERINKVIIIDTKQWRKRWLRSETDLRKVYKELTSTHYDVVFDMQGNVKSGLLTFFAKAKDKVGFKHPREWPNKLFTNIKFHPPFLDIRCDYVGMVYHFFKKQMPRYIKDVPQYFQISEKEKNKIDQLLQQVPLEHKTKVLICPQSAWENKRLSQKALEELMQEMQKAYNCFFFISWGSEEEKREAESLAVLDNCIVIDRYLLTTLHYLMQQMDYVLAMDSISLHMAAVAKTKTLSIFGPTSAHYYAPKGENHFTIQGECPYKVQFKKQCPKMRSCETGACMKNLGGKELFDAFDIDIKREKERNQVLDVVKN